MLKPMFPIIPSTLTDQTLIQQTRQLASQWAFEYAASSSEPFYLQLTPDQLQLVTADQSAGPVYIDFASGAIDHRRKFGGGKGQTLAKAVGLHKTCSPVILDATAGMGKDAFVFASLGARVILMERAAVAAALLSDALERGQNNPEIADIIKRMRLFYDDATRLTEKTIKQWPDKPDVIYLDPMFPHRKKTAQVKKEMLIFQKILGSDLDSDQLLAAALNIAPKRVVVKRPIKAPYLNQQQPSYTLKMKKHRFDIYITS